MKLRVEIRNFYSSLILTMYWKLLNYLIHGILIHLYARTTNNDIEIDKPLLGYKTLNNISNESIPIPRIDKVDIISNIQFRYAKTVVKVYIKNPSIQTKLYLPASRTHPHYNSV